MAQNIDNNYQDNIITNILHLHTNNRVAICAFRNKLTHTIDLLERQFITEPDIQNRADIRIKITFFRTMKLTLDIIIQTRYN